MKIIDRLKLEKRTQDRIFKGLLAGTQTAITTLKKDIAVTEAKEQETRATLETLRRNIDILEPAHRLATETIARFKGMVEVLDVQLEQYLKVA